MKSSLEERVLALESRNERVEADKAWETSWTRRVAIAVLTYACVAAYLGFVLHSSPWLNALVPVMGFLLSTLTVSLVRRHWLKKHRNTK